MPYTTKEKRRAHDGTPEFLTQRRLARLKAKGFDENSTKRCLACNEEKPLTEFHRHGQNGVRPRCKGCRAIEARGNYDPIQSRANYLAHREERRSQMLAYRQANLGKIRAKDKAYRDSHTLMLKSKYFVRRYGITLEQWEEIFDRQGRACAICRSPTPGNPKGWHTDHGLTIRGILCHHCNCGIGLFNHDITRLKAAVRYLDI